MFSSCGLAATQYVLLQSIAAAPRIGVQLSEQFPSRQPPFAEALRFKEKGAWLICASVRAGADLQSDTCGARSAKFHAPASGSLPDTGLRSALGEKDLAAF